MAVAARDLLVRGAGAGAGDVEVDVDIHVVGALRPGNVARARRTVVGELHRSPSRCDVVLSDYV